MRLPEISLVVTDLDNTLWDWFDLWYSSFKPLLDELVRVTGIPETTLKPEIKVVHERFRTSEYSYLLQELPSLQNLYGAGFHPYDVLPTVIAAAQEGRKAASRPYPGTLEALREIRSRGAVVVGFTESQLYYTAQRIRTLGRDSGSTLDT